MSLTFRGLGEFEPAAVVVFTGTLSAGLEFVRFGDFGADGLGRDGFGGAGRMGDASAQESELVEGLKARRTGAAGDTGGRGDGLLGGRPGGREGAPTVPRRVWMVSMT